MRHPIILNTPKGIKNWCREQLLTRSREVRDCWIWTGPSRQDYGILYIPKIGQVQVHRLAMFIFKPEIFTLDMLADKKIFICHHCDVKKCFNPKHLYVGNPKTNSQDYWKRRPAIENMIFSDRIEI